LITNAAQVYSSCLFSIKLLAIDWGFHHNDDDDDDDDDEQISFIVAWSRKTARTRNSIQKEKSRQYQGHTETDCYSSNLFSKQVLQPAINSTRNAPKHTQKVDVLIHWMMICNIQGGPIKTVHFWDTIFLQSLQI